MRINTFPPYEIDATQWDTDWCVPTRLSAALPPAALVALVAAKRAVLPTGGLDGGSLNRLATQLLTGLSPEQLPEWHRQRT